MGAESYLHGVKKSLLYKYKQSAVVYHQGFDVFRRKLHV